MTETSGTQTALGGLDRDGRKAFVASGAGWALDSYDYQIFPLGLVAISATFGLTDAQAGWISTVTLLVSALGGVLAGALADRIGRVRTLMVTVATYSVFTFLCGFAPNYETLLIFRALEGLGFGGEWAAGAILMAEYAKPETRGRVLGMIQSSWAIGWAVAVCVYLASFSLFDQQTAWRVLFWVGLLPALLLFYIRRGVPEPEVYLRTRKAVRAKGELPPTLVQIFRADLLRTTVLASLLATGVQGGYYAIITWLPSYLEKARDLDAVGTAGYLFSLIGGSFLGYVYAGYLADRLGRRKTFALFSVASGILIVAYTGLPAGQNWLLLILGVPLGFFSSGLFSGFGSYLAELYPSRARGAGQGFCYNVGRAIGAVFPAVVGYLSTTLGPGGAIAFGALGYLLALLSLLGLPETRGAVLRAETEPG